MKCQRVQECFTDYQNGSLSAAESAQLHAHLDRCVECQREWSALEIISQIRQEKSA